MDNSDVICRAEQFVLSRQPHQQILHTSPDGSKESTALAAGERIGKLRVSFGNTPSDFSGRGELTS
jgi:hypothetical protein